MSSAASAVPASGPAPVSTGVWCAALRVEARAVARGCGAAVTAVGMRARRHDRLESVAARAAGGPVRLLGFGGGLDPRQRTGDVVVASEIRHAGGRVELPSAPAVLARLRGAGLAASAGPLWSADHIVRGRERVALAASGMLAVDMESAALAAACGAERLAVVRVVVDTPSRGIARASVFGGRRARAVLRQAAAALAGDEPPAGRESITSGTVNVAAQETTSATGNNISKKEG